MLGFRWVGRLPRSGFQVDLFYWSGFPYPFTPFVYLGYPLILGRFRGPRPSLLSIQVPVHLGRVFGYLFGFSGTPFTSSRFLGTPIHFGPVFGCLFSPGLVFGFTLCRSGFQVAVFARYGYQAYLFSLGGGFGYPFSLHRVSGTGLSRSGLGKLVYLSQAFG